MNRYIPKNFIRELISQINIVELISTRIKLKKKGKHYNAICPFHNDTKPSFIVNYEQQYFYCFGCNIHGNIIDFLMKYDQLTFLESIEEITNIFNIDIPYKKNENHQKKYIYESMKMLSKIYYNNIIKNKNNIAYLYLKKRNINKNTIKNFNLGYSNLNHNIINKIFNHNQISNLIKGGVIFQNKKGYKYDIFKERIIFPIKNKYNEIIGFGGRNLNNKEPKYINSPKTNIFNKGNQLYGIHEINSKIKYLIVVEGYFDLVSLKQFNIKNTVSTLGTSTTDKQIQILFRLTQCIIYCYDGDEAGKNAAWQTLKKSLSYIKDQYQLKFIFLPNGEDPDSIIHKEGKKKFKKRIQNSVNMIDFFFSILLKKINLHSINGKIKLANIAIPLINKIPGTLTKIYFRKILGKAIGIVDEYQLKKIFHEKNTYIKKKKNKNKSTNMRILISLLIQNPKIVNIVPCSIQELKTLKIRGLPIFFKIFETCKKYKIINTGQLIEIYRNKKIIFSIIKKLAFWDNMIEEKKINNVFLDFITKIYDIKLEKQYNKLIVKDRIIGLNKKEKKNLWKINKTLSKKKKK